MVDPETGMWVWRRMADVRPDDLVPMQLDALVGEPRVVPLPVLDQAYYTGDRGATVPDVVTPELAELVGYFMGAGSLQAGGIRVRVPDADLDVVERLQVLAKDLFHTEPTVTSSDGHRDVVLTVRPAGPLVAGRRLQQGAGRTTPARVGHRRSLRRSWRPTT